jgi:hypothetical protein
LIAREAEHSEALIFVLTVKRLQSGVLRGKPTSAGRVHDKKYLVAVISHRGFATVNVFERDIVQIGHWGLWLIGGIASC